MNEAPRSVYKLGAENGLLMGPLLSATAILMGASVLVPQLFWPTLLLMATVPALCYGQLYKSYIESPAQSTFSALWLQGICSFFFGGLIMAAVVLVCLRWIWPSYIYNMAMAVIEVYDGSGSEQAEQIAGVLKQMAETSSLPTAIDIVLELIYAVVFTGSLLSMAVAGIVRLIGKRRPPIFPNKL